MEQVNNFIEELIQAAQQGSLQGVREAMLSGADVNAGAGMALVRASWNGHLEVVQYLVAHGADVRANDCHAMWRAACDGHLAVVQFLVGKGADPRVSNDWPLRLAAEHNRLDVVRYLMELGADMHAGCHDGAFVAAVGNSHVELVRYFVEHGADVNRHDGRALWAASINGSLELVRYLIDHGAQVSAANHQAVVDGARYKDVLLLLLAHGGNSRAQDDAPLCTAAESGNLHTVQHLVALGANVHAQDNRPLRIACKHGHMSVVEFLVSAGANAHVHGSEALTAAAENGYVEVVRCLLENGADLHAHEGAAVLAAIRCRRWSVIRFLRPYGVQRYLKSTPKTDLDKSKKKGFVRWVELLCDGDQASCEVVVETIGKPRSLKGKANEVIAALADNGQAICADIKDDETVQSQLETIFFSRGLEGFSPPPEPAAGPARCEALLEFARNWLDTRDYQLQAWDGDDDAWYAMLVGRSYLQEWRELSQHLGLKLVLQPL